MKAPDLTDPRFMAFADYLHAQNYGMIIPLDERRYAAVMGGLAYSVAIIVGYWLDRTGYEDRWCYKTGEEATVALVEWFLADPQPPEPSGWFRHPDSGRRRPDGDPSKEYINF